MRLREIFEYFAEWVSEIDVSLLRKETGKFIRRINYRLAGIFLLALVVLVYIWGLRHYRNRFLPNTTINGIDYSGMTADQAREHFQEEHTGKQITLLEMDGETEVIDCDSIGYNCYMYDSFENLIDRQSRFKWVSGLFKENVIEVRQDIVYGELTALDKIRELKAVSGKDVVEPSDARIEKVDGKYKIIKEVVGNSIDENKLNSLIADAIKNNKTEINLVSGDCYKKPALYEDDPKITEQFEYIDNRQNETIKVAIDEGISDTLTNDAFLDWMEFEDKKVRIDQEALSAYVDGLAEKYDTFKTKRQFKTTKGDVITVGGDDFDTYGYIMNREETCAAIEDALCSGKDMTATCVWDQKAKARNQDGSDIGDTYVEVSIDEQHLWYYKNGKLFIETPVVTGTANSHRSTPHMLTQILNKATDYEMHGSYGSSFAKYAMWVSDEGILIHDASWRDEYGGDIYTYNGSHGCINTPLEAVIKIFDDIEIGTPVIVYERGAITPDTVDGEEETVENYEEFGM